MGRNDNLELKGICQFEMEIDLTYRSIEGPTAYKIKKVKWENVNIGEIHSYQVRPVVKWYEDFAVISIGKEPVFDDKAQHIINERLELNGNTLGYCDEESLAIMIGMKLLERQKLVEMFTAFFTKDKWVSYGGNNIAVSATPVWIM